METVIEREKKISFVIPCYNSTNTIGNVVNEIKNVMECNMEQYSYEIILVNDGSPDGTTYDTIVDIAEKEKNIKCINLSRNFGQPSAVMAALNYVSGDYIVCGDDDGQTPFIELPKLFEKLMEGYDLVEAKYATREKRSLFRKFGTMMNEGMATWLIAKPKGLELTSYWVTKRFVVDSMITYRNPYPYVGGLMLRITQNACNAEVAHRERLSGKSGYNIQKMISLWMNGFTSFSTKPLHLISCVGICVAIIGCISGVAVVINKIANPNINAGYSSIMAVLLFMFGMLFAVLGLLGEYIGRIYISLNNSPQYIVKDYYESSQGVE